MTDSPHVDAELRADLVRLGVLPGDLIVLHSAYKAVGRPDVPPADFIATLLDALGPGGSLMAPTFTYSYAGLWAIAPFDVDATPGLHNGVLTEALRHTPGARRSAHPTYSVAAIGPHAARLTAGKENASALGRGSSYGEAHQLGARILLLGVGNDRNSMLHYAEVAAGLPYLDIPWRAHAGSTALVRRAGQVVEVPVLPEYPACSLGFGVVDAYLEARGLLRRGRVGAAPAMLLDSRTMVAAVVDRLQAEPGWLLCDTFGCEPCTLRKRRLHSLGLL
jgi:aminoglycoside 3-N-acetyltransferase